MGKLSQTKFLRPKKTSCKYKSMCFVCEFFNSLHLKVNEHKSNDCSFWGLNVDLNFDICFLLTLSAKIQQVSVHTFTYVILQAIAKTSIHTKNEIQSSEMSIKLPVT